MRLLFTILFLTIVSSSYSQYRIPSYLTKHRSSRHKNSLEKGAIFFSWGFNRSFYTDSKIHFEGNGHNFDLSQVRGEDNQSNRFSGNFYNPLSWTKTQYNVKLGYYFKNKWAMTIALDHMKYQIVDNSGARLNGQVTFTKDEDVYFNEDLSFYHGNWLSKPVIIDKDYFDYNTNGGMNYLHFEWTKSRELYNYNTKRPLVINAYMGFGTGVIISNVNYTFKNQYNVKARSFSGYGASVLGGVRVEFFRRLYLYSNISFGVLHQVHAKTIDSDSFAYARQLLTYGQFDAGLGILFFKRPKNGCDDCPIW